MLTSAVLALSAVASMASGASALLSLPYTKCDTASGCATRSTTIVMDGPSTDYSGSSVYQSGTNGLLLTAPVSRSYLVSPNGTSHEQFFLKNRQLTITIDASKVQCGYNAAFYFSSMPASAPIGTKYCDGQGTWCNEFDVYEGNIGATAVTTHGCDYTTGVCDPWGCGVNSYITNYGIGPGLTINSLLPYTITTKFYTDSGTDTGTLNKIQQVYTQGSKTVTLPAIQESSCSSGTYWTVSGKMGSISKSLDYGQTMIFSFWGTGGTSMSWLDGGASANSWCSSASSSVNQVTFSDIIVNYIDGAAPAASSTTKTTTTTTKTSTTTTKASTATTTTRTSTTTTKAATTTTKAATTTTTTTKTTSAAATTTGACAAKYSQCGGNGFTGITTCCSGSTCTVGNEWYSQCI